MTREPRRRPRARVAEGNRRPEVCFRTLSPVACGRDGALAGPLCHGREALLVSLQAQRPSEPAPGLCPQQEGACAGGECTLTSYLSRSAQLSPPSRPTQPIELQAASPPLAGVQVLVQWDPQHPSPCSRACV